MRWDTSTASISSDYVIIKADVRQTVGPSSPGTKMGKIRTTLLSQYPSLEKIDAAPIWIEKPEEAIRRMFVLKELPDQNWFERIFKQYRIMMIPELIAAGWRFIAINQIEKKHGNQARLVRFWQTYVDNNLLHDDQTRVPNIKTLEILSQRMLSQLEAGDSDTSVLVSTSPRAKT